MQNAAMLAFGLALPELDPGHRLLELSLDRHRRYLRVAVAADGVSGELSTGYHCAVTRFLLFHLLRRQASGLAAAPGEQEQLERMVAFLDELRWPDGTLPAIGDTAHGLRCDGPVPSPPGWPTWPMRSRFPPPHGMAARPAMARTWPSEAVNLSIPASEFVVFSLGPKTA